MNPEDIIGNFSIGGAPTSELKVNDRLDLARSVWRKGRHESLGGPICFTQDGKNNNNRTHGYPPMGRNIDPITSDLGVDITEQ